MRRRLREAVNSGDTTGVDSILRKPVPAQKQGAAATKGRDPEGFLSGVPVRGVPDDYKIPLQEYTDSHGSPVRPSLLSAAADFELEDTDEVDPGSLGDSGEFTSTTHGRLTPAPVDGRGRRVSPPEIRFYVARGDAAGENLFAYSFFDVVSALKPMTNIRELNLAGNNLRDVDLLQLESQACLNELTDLWLCRNQIVEVISLASLVNLKLLDLHNNQIEDVTPLASLQKLEVLDLHNNQIEDVSSLKSLVLLTQLDLRGNPVTNMEELRPLLKSGSFRSMPDIPKVDEVLKFTVTVTKHQDTDEYSITINVRESFGKIYKGDISWNDINNKLQAIQSPLYQRDTNQAIYLQSHLTNILNRGNIMSFINAPPALVTSVGQTSW